MSLSPLVLDATEFLIDFVFLVLAFAALVVGNDFCVVSVVVSSTHSPHLEWSLPEPIQNYWIKTIFNFIGLVVFSIKTDCLKILFHQTVLLFLNAL